MARLTKDVGARIVAVRDATDEVIHLFGRGVYAGDHPRPGSGNWSPDTIAMARRVIEEGLAEDKDELRARDDAFMARRIAESVAEGKCTQAEADADLAEYRRLRLEREAARDAMTVDELVTELLTGMDLNPRLDLDDGSVVWGCECWWMPEAEFESFKGSRQVVAVPAPRREPSTVGAGERR